MQKICIIGAGLAGSLAGLLLSKLGFEVHIYEKRPDPRTDESEGLNSEFGASTSATKRSINLALSYRGIKGLTAAGLLDQAMETAIAMPKRVIHFVNSNTVFQAYGKADESLWSVGRQNLNEILLDEMKRGSHAVSLHFGHTLQSLDKAGNCVFIDSKSNITNKSFDLVIGADGAYSAVRDNIMKQSRMSFSRQYIPHGYKELTIPAITVQRDNKTVLDYALENHEGLHIWPRGEFMLIALPNPEKSFTATLFAPYHGSDGFDSIDPNNADDVTAYFQKYFPDVVPLMPSLIEDYRSNPVGSLVTIQANPWNYGRTVLIGDAAHAVVPFYGQGMNAAFEDGWILYDIVRKAMSDSNTTAANVDLVKCGAVFAEQRRPAADGLSALCLEHYHDMASNTASLLYLLQKKVESAILTVFPHAFKPLYSMVAFSDIPYHQAVEIVEQRDRLIRTSLVVGFTTVGAIGLAFGLKTWRK